MTSPAHSLKPPRKDGLFETIRVVLEALAIAMVVRTLIFQLFWIPSSSLVPTLLVGDYLIVSKYSYGYSHYSLPGLLDLAPKSMPGRLFYTPPKRGDILVFRPPYIPAHQPQEDYIKRVIGLPGDRVQMIDGRLFLNGKSVPLDFAPSYVTEEGAAVPTYWETLPTSDGAPNGVRHKIIRFFEGKAENTDTEVFIVPPDHFFMMGDNRDDSEDSRVIDGPVRMVPAENVIGRAEVVLFSVGHGAALWQFWRWPWTLRWDRFFMPIH